MEGGGLRITFTRLADRFGHAIALVNGDMLTPLLESIEGQSDDAWPPSPPLQELHIEQRAGGVQVALLVGRAGRAHWSASIALDPQARRVEFDIACRTREPAARLGGGYRLPQTVAELTDSRARWSTSPAARLEVVAKGESLATFRADTPDQLAIAISSESGPWPRTVRWGYAITLSRP
jgi:hypothetical protein